jgi:hypothetical protein
MKLISATFCVAAICAVGLGAQTSEKTTKTKIEIKDGKDVTVTGCVKSGASGTEYMLTNVADNSGAMHSYILVSDDDNLSKHVGHRVQIQGKAADRGDGKVKTETKTTVKVDHGDDKETKATSEVKGDLAAMPYLGVKSVKMIAASCP